MSCSRARKSAVRGTGLSSLCSMELRRGVKVALEILAFPDSARFRASQRSFDL